MDAFYTVEKKAKIIVASNDFSYSGRNSAGDFVPISPRITLSADLDGTWDTQQKMDADMSACVEKLLDAYRNHLSGRDH